MSTYRIMDEASRGLKSISARLATGNMTTSEAARVTHNIAAKLDMAIKNRPTKQQTVADELKPVMDKLESIVSGMSTDKTEVSV